MFIQHALVYGEWPDEESDDDTASLSVKHGTGE